MIFDIFTLRSCYPFEKQLNILLAVNLLYGHSYFKIIIPFTYQIKSVSRMKQVLQAQINVLIENNKKELMQIERQKTNNNKRLKSKYSFSNYEEPSQRQGRYTDTKQELVKRYLDQNLQGIYKKRFSEMQRKKYESTPIEELKKQQKSFKKAIQNIHKQINTFAIKEIDNQLLTVKSQQKNQITLQKNNSLPHINQKENKQNIKYMPQKKGKAKKETKQDESYIENQFLLNQTELVAARLAQLHNEYSHLVQELNKFIKPENQIKETDNIQISIQQFDKESSSLAKLIKTRKHEIKSINYDIDLNSKILLRQNNLDIDGENEQHLYATTEQLQTEIHKRNIKNKEKTQYLESLHQKIRGLKLEEEYKQPLKENEQSTTICQSNVSFIKTAKSTKTTSKTRTNTPNKLKVKEDVSLNNSLNAYDHVTPEYLLKKKEVILKSIQSDNKRWKSIYTQKMKQLVNEYSNLSDINRIEDRLQNEKSVKQQEITFWRDKHQLKK